MNPIIVHNALFVVRFSNLLVWCCDLLLDEFHADGTDDEEDAGDDHHVALVAAYEREEETATESGDDLRHADRAVEES